MRKGFTMIELIFVIVILGVLASVAIPRLAATRDDAEMAKAATNVVTAISDITAYYTAKGSFSTNYTDMTNALDSAGKFQIKSKDCVAITATEGTDANNPAKIKLVITPTNSEPVCTALQTLPSIKTMCKNNVSNCEIIIGGSQVTW